MKRESFFRDVKEGRFPLGRSDKTLGWQLVDVDPDKGWIRVQFEAKPEFVNPAGVIQGGYLSAMLDCTMGPGLLATLEAGSFVTTIELKVNYIRPAQVGKLIAEANVVHRGRSICFSQGQIRDVEGNLIATATATQRIVSLKQPGGTASGAKEAD